MPQTVTMPAMNVLSMGLPFGADRSLDARFRSSQGHYLRTLAISDQADYHFEAHETASKVVERISADWTPDLLLCWLPELFPPPLEIEAAPIKTAAVVSDWNVYHAQIECNLARYDVVLTDKLGSQELKLVGATPQYLFPIYSQRSNVHTRLDVPKDIDILFAGNLNHAVHTTRARLLEGIASLSDRYKVVICNGYEDEEYARLLSRSRIVFNHSIRREMNLRCFEALACGSLLFLEEDNLEVGDYLQDRKEVVLYKPENLLELLTHYLRNPEEAQAIAARGHAKAEELAGENRLDALFDWLDRQPSGNRAFTGMAEDTRDFATVLQYVSSLEPSQQQWASDFAQAMSIKYPEHPEFLTAAAGTRLSSLASLTDEERGGGTQEVLQALQKACGLSSGSAVLWSNLGRVCRLAEATEAEIRCLQAVLEAPSTDYGNILFGHVSEPCYALWKSASATGTEQAEILHAAALTHLASIYLERGELQAARESAEKAIGMTPHIHAPYAVLADAERASGHAERALEVLVDALPLTSFDASHRQALVQALTADGRSNAAHTLAQQSATLFRAVEGCEQIAEEFLAMANDRPVQTDRTDQS